MLWGRSMTEAERERLSRNLAEVIDDLYRLIQLVQVQIRHAMSLAERSARHDREGPHAEARDLYRRGEELRSRFDIAAAKRVCASPSERNSTDASRSPSTGFAA